MSHAPTEGPLGVVPWLYMVLRLLHILGSMVLLGGVTTALWWKLGADRMGDASYAARAHRQLRKLDGQIIGPAAIVVFASGYTMVRLFGGRIAEHLFVLFGLIWLFLALALWYLGMRNTGDKLVEEAESAHAKSATLGADYARHSAKWVMSAGGAILFLVLAAVFMIFKLPGA